MTRLEEGDAERSAVEYCQAGIGGACFLSDDLQSPRDEDAAVAQERELDAAEDLSDVGTEEETESAELEEETEVESEERESERIEEREAAAMGKRSKRPRVRRKRRT